MSNRLLTEAEARAESQPLIDKINASGKWPAPSQRKKRGGRKLGSKNRPKPDQSAEIARLKARIEELESVSAAQLNQKLRSAAKSAANLLETSANIRVSAMDSDNRLKELLANQTQAVRMVAEMLRGAM